MCKVVFFFSASLLLGHIMSFLFFFFALISQKVNSLNFTNPQTNIFNCELNDDCIVHCNSSQQSNCTYGIMRCQNKENGICHLTCSGLNACLHLTLIANNSHFVEINCIGMFITNLIFVTNLGILYIYVTCFWFILAHTTHICTN